MSLVTIQEVDQDVQRMLNVQVTPVQNLLATYTIDDRTDFAIFWDETPPNLTVNPPGGIEAIIKYAPSDPPKEYLNQVGIQDRLEISLSLWQPWHIAKVLDTSDPILENLYQPATFLDGMSVIRFFQTREKYRYEHIGHIPASERHPQVVSFYWLPYPSVCDLGAIV